MDRLSVLVLVAACNGGGGSSSDAPTNVSEAAVDGEQCATMKCGSTCCPSLAHACSTSGTSCECPAALVPEPFATVIEQMDTMRIAPDVVGIGVVDGPDGNLHALVIGFHPTDTAINTDHALPVTPLGDAPFVALGYDINVIAQTTRSTYFVSQGTLRLTRRCSTGVAGSMAGIMLREQTAIEDSTPHPQGCSVSVPDLAFDFGGACP